MNKVWRRVFDSDRNDHDTVAGSCKKANGPWHYTKWSEILWSMVLNKLGYRHDVASHHAPYYCRHPIPEQFSIIFCHILTLRWLMLYTYMEHPILMFLDHTQRRSTVGRTPLDEWSARRRDLYLTTHDTHNRQISMPAVGFEPKISAYIYIYIYIYIYDISRLRVKKVSFFDSVGERQITNRICGSPFVH